MLKKIGLTFLIVLVLSSYTYAAGPLASSLRSTSHSKSSWSNNNKITMSWDKPAASSDYGNVTGYAILWDTTADSNPGTTITLDANATGITSSPLSDSQSIYFHIRVIYEGGSPFEWDNFGPFQIDTTPPSKPTSFTTTAGDGTLTLKWTNAGDADLAGVVIRRSTASGTTCSYPSSATAGDPVAEVTKDASPNNSYSNTGLTNNTTYCYSLFSYDQRATGMRNYSGAAQANGKPVASGAAATYATVTASDPNNNAADVAITTTISVGFSKDMNSSTLNSNTITVKDASNNAVAGNYAYTSTTKTVKFTPTSSLSYSTRYGVTILSGSSGVKDSQGNNFDGNANGVAEDAPTDNYGFGFTTVAPTPPDVTSISPADASTNVALNQNIVIVFTKNLNSNTVSSSTIQVAIGSTSVAGTITYNDLDKSVTFTPSSNYTGGATITVTVVGGANGIKDSSGLQLKNNSYTYSFKVVETPILQVSGTSLDFGNVSSSPQLTKSLNLTVTNIGQQRLYFGTASVLVGTYYSITADTCSTNNFAKDASCSITVRFAPTTTGTLSTTLVISSNSGRTDTTTSTAKNIALTGVGVNTPTAGINVNPTSIDFGTIMMDASSNEISIVITSNGTLNLQLGTITLQKGNVGFAITDKTACENQSISFNAPNNTCTIKARFTPTAEGTATDQVIIKSNNGGTTTTASYNSTVNLNAFGKKNSVTIDLLAGWNLISLALKPADLAVSKVLNGIAGSYAIAWEFTPPSTWKSYDPADPDYSELQNLTAGKGYWVKTTEAITLTLP